MTLTLMGKKKGMTRLFDEKGNLVVCTVIHAEPNIVSQIKSRESDGYVAVQLSSVTAKASKFKKPQQGHFKKANVDPRRHSVESRLKGDEPEYSLGQEIDVEFFSEIKYVDVVAQSKGKGHQGVIKRWGFSGGPASHGSGFHRHGGSTGMRSTPGRCLPGQKKSGRMGGERVTVQNLEVVKIDKEKQVIVVKGAIPGSREGLVYISKANKVSSARQVKK